MTKLLHPSNNAVIDSTLSLHTARRQLFSVNYRLHVHHRDAVRAICPLLSRNEDQRRGNKSFSPTIHKEAAGKFPKANDELR